MSVAGARILSWIKLEADAQYFSLYQGESHQERCIGPLASHSAT